MRPRMLIVLPGSSSTLTLEHIHCFHSNLCNLLLLEPEVRTIKTCMTEVDLQFVQSVWKWSLPMWNITFTPDKILWSIPTPGKCQSLFQLRSDIEQNDLYRNVSANVHLYGTV